MTVVAAALACSALAPGCVETGPVEVTLDRTYFECNVQPVWDRSCSALGCHGDARRPFHVFTRNRMRLDGTNTERNRVLSQQEMDHNFNNSVGFATSDPDASWLLRKPLDPEAGGFFHFGKELFEGDDVWTSDEDKEYATVRAWLGGATADPASCSYPGFQ